MQNVEKEATKKSYLYLMMNNYQPVLNIVKTENLTTPKYSVVFNVLLKTEHSSHTKS